ERRTDKPPGLGRDAGILPRRLARSGHGLVHGRHERLLSSTHGTQPVDCPRLRAHDYPGLWAPPPGVIACGFLPDLPEDLLQDLFGCGQIAQDASDQAQSERSEGVVEAAEGLAVT